jgi:hypothetical protein
MKKIFQLVIIGALTVAPFAGNAQLKAGKFFIGGSAYVTSDQSANINGSTTTRNPGETRLGLSPAAGYMLNDKWAALLELGYTTTIKDNKLTGNDNKVESTPNFRIAVGARRYLMFGQRFGLFADGKLQISFGSTSTKQDNVITSYSSTSFSALAAPGIACFITDRLMLESQIGYLEFYSSTNETGQDTKRRRNVFGFSLHPGSLANIGLKFFF